MQDLFSDKLLEEKFFKDGFVVIPFLTQEEILDLLSYYEANNPEMAVRGFHATMNTDNPVYREKIDVKLKPIIEKKINSLLVNYRPLFSNYVIKKPETDSDVGVHQDWTYVDESKYVSVNIWCPLVDVNAENGGLYVFKGSHQLNTPERYTPYIYPEFGDLIGEYSELLELQAGHAVIYHSGLFHYSPPNKSGFDRPAFACVAIPNDAQAVHYFRDMQNGSSKLEIFEVDEQFFYTHIIGERPMGFEKTGEIDLIENTHLLEEIESLHKKNVSSNGSVQPVESYYDEWNDKYMDVYGDVIQAYRPSKKEELLDYIITCAGLKDGYAVLDAGCGVCGPSIFFAEKLDMKIDAVTISQKQVDLAEKKISDKGLQDKIVVKKGDYHYLEDLYPKDHYDMVMFIESLGHAQDPNKVIESAFQVLKAEGYVYIKDFFPREVKDPVLQERIRKTIDNMNRHYSYNVLDLHDTLTSLRKAGFIIEFIKKPEFESDVSVRAEFESRFNIDVFEGGEFMPAEWLEIKCQKFFY